MGKTRGGGCSSTCYELDCLGGGEGGCVVMAMRSSLC